MPSARRFTSLLLLALVLRAAGQAPAPAPQRFRYTFSNFVWWTDAELRTELGRRAKGVPAEIVPGSGDEQKLRKALGKLLRLKHVRAEVQTSAPDPALGHSEGDPPEAIRFRIVPPPEIDVESVSGAPGSPAPLAAEVARLNRIMAAHPYAAEEFPFRERRVASALADAGYLAASVSLEHGSPHPGPGGKVLVPVTVTANPGPLFHVSEVTADGGPLLEGRSLSRFFGVHPGDVATPHAFPRLESSVRLLYQQKGFADVRVEDAPTLDIAHATASYHFRVVPGPQFRVGKLEIHGLSPAQSGEARAALGLRPGDLYNERAVAELYRKLKSSPTLLGQTFSYTVRRNSDGSTVDLALDFSPDAPKLK